MKKNNKRMRLQGEERKEVPKVLHATRFSRKGQALVSHTIFFVFSILLILTIVTSFGTIRNDAQKFIGNDEIQQVCTIIRTSINKIYSVSDYSSPTTTVLGEIITNLPNRIADESYRARFVNSTIVIETSQPGLNGTCETGFDVNFTGSTPGGRTQIEWVRYSNGGTVIAMARV